MSVLPFGKRWNPPKMITGNSVMSAFLISHTTSCDGVASMMPPRHDMSVLPLSKRSATVGKSGTGCRHSSLPDSSTSTNAVIWACAGADVSSIGSYLVVVVESGADVSATGAYGLVYAKAGSGVTSTGAYTEVSAEIGPDVELLGTGAVLHECPAITVDASAVAGGCG